MVPSQQPRNPIGIVTMPGNVSGDGEPCESGPGHTGGLSTIMITEAVMPKAMPVSAPVVLKRRQNSASSSGGKFALAANTNAMLTSTVTLKPEPIASVPRIAADADADRGDAGDLALALLGAAPEHVLPQVVGDRAGARRSRGPRRRRGSSRTRPRRTAPARCRRRPSRHRRRATARAAARRGCRPCRRPRSRPGRARARAPKPMIVTIAVNDAMMPIV